MAEVFWSSRDPYVRRMGESFKKHLREVVNIMEFSNMSVTHIHLGRTVDASIMEDGLKRWSAK